MRVPVLWLIGPSGVGKTTLARVIYARLGAQGVPAAHVDTDMLAICSAQPPADDPQAHRLKAANLGALWPNYRARHDPQGTAVALLTTAE